MATGRAVAGGTAGDATFGLRIGGMSCASCVAHVEKAILAVPGVAEASVNLATERAEVRFTTAPDAAAVAKAVTAAGYEVGEETTDSA